MLERSVRGPDADAVVCLAGARACPPEDCGGIGGYADFLAALANRRHQRHVEMREWTGGEFHPEAFDLDAVNHALARGRRWPPSA